jgi:hypothetical protein
MRVKRRELLCDSTDLARKFTLFSGFVVCSNSKIVFLSFDPPTQETTALAVEKCVTLEAAIAAIDLLCFGGFRKVTDDPPKLGACAPKRFSAQGRRWVRFLGTTGLPVGLHKTGQNIGCTISNIDSRANTQK